MQSLRDPRTSTSKSAHRGWPRNATFEPVTDGLAILPTWSRIMQTLSERRLPAGCEGRSRLVATREMSSNARCRAPLAKTSHQSMRESLRNTTPASNTTNATERLTFGIDPVDQHSHRYVSKAVATSSWELGFAFRLGANYNGPLQAQPTPRLAWVHWFRSDGNYKCNISRCCLATNKLCVAVDVVHISLVVMPIFRIVPSYILQRS